MERSVLERLDRAAELWPDKTMLKDSERSLAFSDFSDLSKRIGTALAGRIEAGKPVAVLSGRHVFTPAAYLGIVRAGCFYAPMDGDVPKARLNQVLSVIDADLMVVDRDHLEVAKELDFHGELAVLEELAECAPDEAVLAARRETIINTSPLYVIFTSGSTGKPKGVITSHLSLMTYIDAVGKVLDINETDICGNQAPLDYIAAIRDIYFPISFGATTYIIPTSEVSIPTTLFATLNREKITSVCWSVSGLEVPTKMGAFKVCRPEYIKKVCFSGSVMSSKLLRMWQDALPDALFVNQYGPTETTASCTYYVVPGKVEEDTVLPIGKPYDNYKIILLNEDGTETPRGEIGQICVGGPALALGYYNNPEVTAASFITSPVNGMYGERIYKTGDLGRWAEDGELEFHGRMDRQVKHFGHRIELGEVEDAARRVDGVENCCALYNKEKEVLWLFYEGAADSKAIVMYFRENMPAYMVPRKLMKLDKLPALPNGKTDMQALKGYF